LRRVPGIGRRLAEAARLGFAAAVIPSTSTDVASSIHLELARDISAAFASQALIRAPDTSAALTCYP
jgi:predicted ATP-dependent serine protease